MAFCYGKQWLISIFLNAVSENIPVHIELLTDFGFSYSPMAIPLDTLTYCSGRKYVLIAVFGQQ